MQDKSLGFGDLVLESLSLFSSDGSLHPESPVVRAVKSCVKDEVKEVPSSEGVREGWQRYLAQTRFQRGPERD
jgi:hypothetical protein